MNEISNKSKSKKSVWISLVLIITIVGAGITTLFILRPWVTHDALPIINTPSNALGYANQDIRVDVTCTDDVGVDTVILSFSTNQVVWTNITITGTGTTFWTGSTNIPPQEIEKTIYYQIYANDTVNQMARNDNSGLYYEIYTGSRKAMLVGSANDFYGTDPEGAFNTSPDSTFDSGIGNWILNLVPGEFELNTGSGDIYFEKLVPTPSEANITYDWIGNGYTLYNYLEYNISAEISMEDGFPVTEGARVGLQWHNSTGIARTDWSDYVPFLPGIHHMNITGVCNNDTDFEITSLMLVISISGVIPIGVEIHIDNVKIDKWIAVNNTDPTHQGSTPSNIDCDGFPAQTLQIYWILRTQGYTDANIFLMLYHKNDPVIDIYAAWHPLNNASTVNDLNNAVIDVEDDGVNATRFKREMNDSISGSFASGIELNDQLIIVLTDHGSNVLLGDGNATFHFEADHSFITEFEFYDLVKEINCSRMLVNIDCCFSGNFLQSHNGVFYDVPNAILVSAASNIASWYWINNQNGNGWAGSWFFNQFWEHLDTNANIMNAFILAANFIPFGRVLPLGISQMPLINDPKNWANTWSFASNPKL